MFWDGWSNPHLTERMGEDTCTVVCAQENRLHMSLCVSSRMVSVGRGDRAGMRVCLDKQSYVPSQSPPWCQYWYTGPTFPPFSSLTHQLSIYAMPSTRSMPLWRYADGQGLVSPLLGGWQQGSCHSGCQMSGVLCSFRGCYWNHQLALLSAKRLPFWASKTPVMQLAAARENGTRDITTLNLNSVFPIPQQCYFLG